MDAASVLQGDPQRQEMTFKPYVYVAAVRQSTLEPTERLALLVMAFLAGREGIKSGLCWASTERIAADAGLSPRGAGNILRRLVQIGALQVVQQRPGRTTVYRLQADALAQREASAPDLSDELTPEPDAYHPGTGFTPAPGAPLNPVPTTQAPASYHPGTGFLPPRNEVPTTPAPGAYDPVKDKGHEAGPDPLKGVGESGDPPPSRDDSSGLLPGMPEPPPKHVPKAPDRYDEVALYFGEVVHRAIGRRPSQGPARSSKLGAKLLRAVKADADAVLDAMRWVAESPDAAFHRGEEAGSDGRFWKGMGLETILRHVEEYAERYRAEQDPLPVEPSADDAVYSFIEEPMIDVWARRKREGTAPVYQRPEGDSFVAALNRRVNRG